MKWNRWGVSAIAASTLLLGNCATDLSPQSVPRSVDGPTAASTQLTADSSHDAVGKSPAKTAIVHEIYDLPGSQVHVVTVPPGELKVRVAIAESLSSLSDLAQAEGAIAAINAGFFDPQNGQTTSYVTVAGTIVADPQQNDRLIQNPDLQPYLPAILNRSEFRIYDCAGQVQYDIVQHAVPPSPGCTLDAAVGAGPQLLPTLTEYEEGFLADNAAGEVIRDALGSRVPNARSAIGIKADGTVILAIATQLPNTDAPTGLSLPALAEFLESLEVQQALNLDGGSSSSLYINGASYFGQANEAGQPIERPIKSILLVR